MCLIWHGTFLYSVLLLMQNMYHDQWLVKEFIFERIICHFIGFRNIFLSYAPKRVFTAFQSGFANNMFVCHMNHPAFKRFTNISVMAFKRVQRLFCKPQHNNFLSEPYTVKKYFQDLLSQHVFFCQINLNNLFSWDNLLFWVSDD